MCPSLRLAPLLVLLITAAAISVVGPPAAAQTQPRRPAQSPSSPQQKPPAPQPAAKPPEPVRPPAPPPPEDVRFKTTYRNSGQTTESVTYLKGQRERFEFQDMTLLKQRDQKRTVQISKAANTYLIAPDGVPDVPVIPGVLGAGGKPPGVVLVATTIVDTGERKTAFGRPARHVKTTIDRQPMPGACDAAKQRIETDGWYIDLPNAPTEAQPDQAASMPPGGCMDQVQATASGDPKALGFPIAYTTTVTADGGMPVVASMEVTEFEITTLDASLFEIPEGLNAAMNVRELSKALSDASEAKLAAADTEAIGPSAPSIPGAARIGVPEFTNKTAQDVDTRALRQRLIADLVEAKLEAVPMAAAPPGDLQKRAAELGYDYLLLAEVTELKVSKPGGLGGLMRKAGNVASAAGGGQAAPKEITESSIAVRLVQRDGKQRLSTTTKGKDGNGFSLQTGLGLARFAGGMYMSMFMGPAMMARLNGLGAANLGGMGLLGNPALYQMQAGGLGAGRGLDATAGAASFLMQQAMTMNDAGGLVGLPGQGPSFDESLGEAVQNASKAVSKALQQK